jgi:chitodextrinase
MAVIKIVPMPGAVGDKGDEGAPGPQGPQGQTGQTGQNGQDALWSYQGAWQSNAAYAVGDLVTYEGQLYYAKAITTAGTLPTDTTKFDLIAAKGEQGETGATGATGPVGADAAWYYNGAYNPGAGYAVGDVVTYEGQTWYRKHANGGNVGDTPSEGLFWDLIAAKGEQGETGATGTSLITSGTWNLIFNTSNGTLVQSAPASGTYAEYYTIGDLVYFDMQYSFANVTDYGSSWYLFNLPFPPRNPNNFSNNTLVTGLVVDTTSPDSGSNVIYGSIQTVHPVTLEDGGWVLLNYQDTANQMELTSVTFVAPASLSGVQVNPYSRVRMSGVYRKA